MEPLLVSPTSDELKTELIARIAWMYYEENQTHQQIARRLGIPRIKVTRLISQARARGIVEVTVHSDKVPYFHLERDLRQQYSLAEAIVTIEANEGEPLYRVLAKAAAQALEQRLTPESIVGVGIGHTLSYLPEFLHLPHSISSTFTTLTGGLPIVRASPAEEESARALLARFADKDWSLCDGISFALIEARGVGAAFSFDHHFAQRGRFRVLGLG